MSAAPVSSDVMADSSGGSDASSLMNQFSSAAFLSGGLSALAHEMVMEQNVDASRAIAKTLIITLLTGPVAFYIAQQDPLYKFDPVDYTRTDTPFFSKLQDQLSNPLSWIVAAAAEAGIRMYKGESFGAQLLSNGFAMGAGVILIANGAGHVIAKTALRAA